MKKKLLIGLLGVLLIISMATGCSGKNDELSAGQKTLIGAAEAWEAELAAVELAAAKLNVSAGDQTKVEGLEAEAGKAADILADGNKRRSGKSAVDDSKKGGKKGDKKDKKRGKKGDRKADKSSTTDQETTDDADIA